MIHIHTFMEKRILIWEEEQNIIFSLPNICNSSFTFINNKVPRPETAFVNVSENIASTIRKCIKMHFYTLRNPILEKFNFYFSHLINSGEWNLCGNLHSSQILKPTKSIYTLCSACSRS